MTRDKMTFSSLQCWEIFWKSNRTSNFLPAICFSRYYALLGVFSSYNNKIAKIQFRVGIKYVKIVSLLTTYVMRPIMTLCYAFIEFMYTKGHAEAVENETPHVLHPLSLAYEFWGPVHKITTAASAIQTNHITSQYRFQCKYISACWQYFLIFLYFFGVSVRTKPLNSALIHSLFLPCATNTSIL